MADTGPNVTKAPGATRGAGDTPQEQQAPVKRVSTEPSGAVPEKMKDWVDLSLYVGPGTVPGDLPSMKFQKGAPLAYYHADGGAQAAARGQIAKTVLKCKQFIKGQTSGSRDNDTAAKDTRKQLDEYMYKPPTTPGTAAGPNGVPPAVAEVPGEFDGAKASASIRLHAWGDGTAAKPGCDVCKQNLKSQGLTQENARGNLDASNQKDLQEGLNDRLQQEDSTGGAGTGAWAKTLTI